MSDISHSFADPQEFNDLLPEDDLGMIAKFYDEIREEWRRVDPQKDYELAQDFDEVTRIIRETFNSQPNYASKAKLEFLNICQQKASELVSYYSPELGSTLLSINREIFGIAESGSSSSDLQEKYEELTEEIKELRAENKRYFDKIVRNSKNSASQALASLPQAKSRFISKIITNPPLKAKPLSLKQLKDFIDKLCVSKSKIGMNETMEEHLYTYLNLKHKQKSTVIEWAASVITAVKQYSAEDNEILLFGKILRNECDESFREFVKQLKNTVRELFKMQIKAKNPLKSNKEIAEIFNDRLKGPIAEDEWKSIVTYIYDNPDPILEYVYQELQDQEVLYTDFLHALIRAIIHENETLAEPARLV